MSVCISSHGEYGSHEMGDGIEGRFVCTRCGVFDEDAAIAALVAAESELRALREDDLDVIYLLLTAKLVGLNFDENWAGSRAADWAVEIRDALAASHTAETENTNA